MQEGCTFRMRNDKPQLHSTPWVNLKRHNVAWKKPGTKESIVNFIYIRLNNRQKWTVLFVRSQVVGCPWNGIGNWKGEVRELSGEHLECSVSWHKWVQFVKMLRAGFLMHLKSFHMYAVYFSVCMLHITHKKKNSRCKKGSVDYSITGVLDYVSHSQV